MPTRRDFLKSVAGATLSLQAVPAKRREVFIGKRRVKVVDIHGHFVAPEELDVVKDTNLARNITSNLNGPLILGPGRIQFMDQQGISMDFVLGDAVRLPFAPETFDVVLNYGALNGYTDSGKALAEMSRVTKPTGLVLFLDEQLYPEASFVEKIYFQRVLSSHNVIHHCPVELMPASLDNVEVHQVYHFYYLCTAHKK